MAAPATLPTLDAWMGVVEALNDRLAATRHITMRWDVIETGGGCTALAGRYDAYDLEIMVTLDNDPSLPATPDRGETYAVAAYRQSTSHLIDDVPAQVLATLPLAAQTLVEIATGVLR